VPSELTAALQGLSQAFVQKAVPPARGRGTTSS